MTSIEPTLEQEIEQLNQDILRSNKGELNSEEVSGTFEMAIEIISKLQAENQALLAKNKELQENYDIILETHNHFLNKPIYAHCDKLEAKVKELEGKGWLPIESAPKDGTIILLLEDHDGEVNTGYWGLEENIFSGTEKKWFSNGCIDNVLTFPNITHWMPLPELPTKIKGE